MLGYHSPVAGASWGTPALLAGILGTGTKGKPHGAGDRGAWGNAGGYAAAWPGADAAIICRSSSASDCSSSWFLSVTASIRSSCSP